MNILRKSIFISLLLAPALQAQSATITFNNTLTDRAVRFYVTGTGCTGIEGSALSCGPAPSVEAGSSYTYTFEPVCNPTISFLTWGCKYDIRAHVEDTVEGQKKKYTNFDPVSPGGPLTATINYPDDFQPA